MRGERKKENMNKFTILFQYFRGIKRYFLLAIITSLLATGFNSLTPQIFKFSIDEILQGNQYTFLYEHLWIIVLVLLVIAILSGISTFLCRYNTSLAGEYFSKNLRDALYSHVQKVHMQWHDQNQTGDIIQRCTSDVEVIRNFVVTQLLEVFRTIFLVLISFTMMYYMNQKLALIVLGFVPVIVLYSGIFYRMISRQFTDADEAEGELSTVVQENATGVRVVRAFGREKFEKDRFEEKNTIFAKMWIKLGTLSGLYWGVGDLITGLQVIAVIVFGTIEAVHGKLTVGEFIAFASYNMTLVWPIRGLGRILSDMSKAGVSFERIQYILQANEEEEAGDSEINNHSIEFKNVSFAYEGAKEQVLKQISFRIEEGQTIGIIGGTGSGKSTIVQLLEKLYTVEEGEITIGGKNINSISVKALRNKIGIVLQEPFLYSKSIKENIAIAKRDASIDEIRRAAQIACLDDTILGFSDGYDTIVGERGITLSGGQRQRLAIARMLIENKPIMVFDDSLSAVDSATDYQIRQALKKEMKHATVIIISHRITTLMGADQIFVLQKGEICERGTHVQLLNNDGLYRKIYDIQMNREEKEMEGVCSYYE